MSGRTLTAGMITELTATGNRPILLLSVEFGSGTVRLWSGFGTLSWNSLSWTGAGELLSLGPAPESTEVRAQGFTAHLAGIDSAYVALALGQARQGKPVTAWLGFLDSASAVVADPVKIFDGRVDGMDMEEDATTTTITCRGESRLVDLTRPRVRRYTDQQQQQDFTADLGMAYVDSLNWEGQWGASTLRDPLPPRPPPAPTPIWDE